MKRFLVGMMVAALASIGFGGVSAFAADDGYSQPPAAQSVCDAGHGAFGAFSHHFEFYGGTNWIAADAKTDGGMGHETGPANSSLGQACIGTTP